MTKKTWIRILIVVSIIWLMCFSDWGFAAEWSNELTGLEILWFSLNFLVSILARMWVFFAKLAGIFLTNSWVYGETLWLDVLLWKYWNVVKNMANFGLWFYFIFAICRWLLKQTKEDVTKKMKDIILWLLVASVWIQASWFMVSVVLDISTITLVAAGNFPYQVISGSSDVEKSMNTSLKKYVDLAEKGKGELISLFPNDENTNSFISVRNPSIGTSSVASKEQLLDLFLPNTDDISWPLYFIWFSILETNVITSINTADKNWIKWTILNTIIQWWTTIVFGIEMILLCVVALMRIIYLWIFIVLSPFAVLLWCVQKVEKKTSWNNDKSAFDTFKSQIDFRTFFINVFRPTIIVLWFWVSVIFVSLMNQVISQHGTNEFKARWITIKSIQNPWDSGKSEGDNTYTTEIDNNLLHFTLANSWRTLLQFILSILTVLIVYYIISFAVKMWDWKDIISKNVKWMQDWLGKVISRTPIVPVPSYDVNGAPISGGLSWEWLSNVAKRKVNNLQYSVDKLTSKQTDKVMEMWWLTSDDTLTQTMQTGIINVWWVSSGLKWLQILEAKRDYINDLSNGIKTDKWKWMTLGPNPWDGGFWAWQFSSWLTDMRNRTGEIQWNDRDIWINMINRWNSASDTEKTLKNMFKKNISGEDNSVGAYARLFGLWNITTWEDLIDADISQK